MESLERAYAWRQAIASAVAQRRMPPCLAEAGHQEYVDDLSLTRAQIRMDEEMCFNFSYVAVVPED